MAEVVVKEIDEQGRISIPAKWRAKWKTDRVALTLKGEKVELEPLHPERPSSMFDSIEIPPQVDFTDTHSLRKALLESRKD